MVLLLMMDSSKKVYLKDLEKYTETKSSYCASFLKAYLLNIKIIFKKKCDCEEQYLNR